MSSMVCPESKDSEKCHQICFERAGSKSCVEEEAGDPPGQKQAAAVFFALRKNPRAVSKMWKLVEESHDFLSIAKELHKTYWRPACEEGRKSLSDAEYINIEVQLGCMDVLSEQPKIFKARATKEN